MERIELYYQIADFLYNICTTLSGAFCFVIWIRPFMADRNKARYAGIVYTIGMLTGALVPFYVNVLFMYGVVVLSVFFVMGRMERSFIAQKLYLVITFFCVRWQAWRVVGCIGNELHLLKTNMNIFQSSDNMFWFRGFAIQLVFETVLGSLLMYGAVRGLLWAYGDRREHMDIREFLLLVMPSASGVIAYGAFRYYNYIYERDSGKSPFELYGSYDYIILVYTLICFATIFVMTYVFRQWKNGLEEDKQKEVLAGQMRDLQSHIEEVERLYRDIRRLRHDIGNHLMTLEQLYGGGNYEEAARYARALQQEVQAVSSEVTSGNPVTDVILSGRKKEMEEKGIRFYCDFHYPGAGEIDAFDVSIILNNALSNAIEAIEREKTISKAGKSETGGDGAENIDRNGHAEEATFVSLKSRLVKNMFIIEFVNNYCGELTLDGVSGLPLTVKSGDSHGFGLINIRHVARKYYGDMEIGTEVHEGRKCCLLRVMLQLA